MQAVEETAVPPESVEGMQSLLHKL